jgi:hypothetical protein
MKVANVRCRSPHGATRRSRAAGLTVAVLLGAVLAVGRGAEAEWKAGLAATKITPDKPVQLSGYASRIQPFQSVEHDLWAKALALEDRTGQRALIVTTDLSGLYGPVADAVVEKCLAKTGLEREQLLLSWSHNHAGPALSLKATPLPGVPPADQQNTIAYTRWLADRLADLAAAALKETRPARLSWGHGVAPFVMNRREPTPKGIILGVNPRGPVDRTVPVLRVEGADGKLLAVLFGCACHNTTLGAKNLVVAGDYAGFAQYHVQDRLPGVQAMFITGCGGDANPYPRDTMELARQHGEELGREVCRVLETKLNPVTGPLKLSFSHAALPFQSPDRATLEKLAADSPTWQRGTARNLLETLDRGEPLLKEHRAPVAVWQFGQSLTLVALSGEVVVDYTALIERELGPLRLWIAAYCHEGIGYIPSKRILEEGGYETRGTSAGWFAPGAQDALVAKVRGLAASVGRVRTP